MPAVPWSAVAGLEDVKTQLQQVLVMPFSKPAAFRAVGLPPPAGVLLHGPPGTGKTLLAQAVATAVRSLILGHHIQDKSLVQEDGGLGGQPGGLAQSPTPTQSHTHDPTSQHINGHTQIHVHRRTAQGFAPAKLSLSCLKLSMNRRLMRTSSR
eukprot:SAG31_NODE_653_length_13152_cov_4.899487_13_plen_153_part_00